MQNSIYKWPIDYSSRMGCYRFMEHIAGRRDSRGTMRKEINDDDDDDGMEDESSSSNTPGTELEEKQESCYVNIGFNREQ